MIGCVIINDETLKNCAYVAISSYRVKVLKSIGDGEKTPAQIVRDTGIIMSHMSKVLSQLKKAGLAVCINEEKKHGRIYRLTPEGEDVYDNIDSFSM